MGFEFGVDHCQNIKAPFVLSITSLVVTSLLTIITLPGNLLICIAMMRNPNKELRTTFNYLLLNVAVSDLVIGAVTDPIFVSFHTRESLGYSVTAWYIPLHMSFFIGCTASLLSIAMLAVERSIAVESNYHRKIQKGRVMKMSIAIWIFSVVFPCIYFKIGYFKTAFTFSIFMVVVTSVIVTAFIRIQSKLRRNKVVVEEPNDVNNSRRQIKRKRAAYERRVTNIFKAILVYYGVCNLPAFVFIMITNLCSSCECDVIHWSRDFLQVCILINCCGNQFLYAWRMRCFIRAFKSLVNKSVSTDESNHHHSDHHHSDHHHIGKDEPVNQ
ncbi:neuromedin-U receptor 1-like [Actinia tenebrosa]|uniref:Neuromedin-U receptor 1-like n=1 Tax=Actinia tenebrosa TaxID=6105 RepID=A0A6P8HX84_ACTTE|nr:neuromedin-U receptor 1-like [Actinia tenebrosa]XP_031557275.1 neuromedin-U receptor 1-like [Actinia tenebrosa]